MPDYKTYICDYHFAGKDWSFKIEAKSLKEAEQRVLAMKYASVKGELVEEIQAADTKKLLISKIVGEQ